MLNDCTAGRHRRCSGGAGRAGAALVTAAVIGIGADQADRLAPTHPLTTFFRLVVAPSFSGPDAFTLGSFTFDPYTAPLLIPDEGWAAFPAPVFPGPPLMNISGGNLDGIVLAPQDFEVFNSSGTEVGTIATAGTILQILGQSSYEITVTSSTPVLGQTAADLPAVETVYDIFKGLGTGIDGAFTYNNVYEATPSGTVADVLGAAVRPVQPGLSHPVAARLRHPQPGGAADSRLRRQPCSRPTPSAVWWRHRPTAASAPTRSPSTCPTSTTPSTPPIS